MRPRAKHAREAVFRKAAVERLMSPDELADTLSIVRPLDWLVVTALALLTAGAVAWATLTKSPITVRGEGILWRPDTAEIRAPQAGRVRRIYVGHGEAMPAGALLMELEPVSMGAAKAALSAPPCVGCRHQGVPVSAPFRGRVLELAASQGDEVSGGAPLLVLEPADAPLQAVLFVSESEGGRIHPGLEVRLRTGSGQPQGVLLGTVERVAGAALTERGLRRVLGTEPLVETLLARGLRLRVDVVLTLRPGDPVPQRSRTPLDGEVVVGHERPISRVLPWLRGGGA